MVGLGRGLKGAETQKPVPHCRWRNNGCNETKDLTLTRIKMDTHVEVRLLCRIHGGGISEPLGSRTGVVDGWEPPCDRGSEINDRYAEGLRR
jgi:hypothetical protein